MNINLSHKIALALGLILLLASCGSPKRYAYLQDVELAKQYSATYDNQIIVRPGDRLNISVSSSYPELVRPFTGQGFDSSIPGLGATNVAGATTSISNNYNLNDVRQYGYLVSAAGEINFPVLGKLKVSGLNKEQVAQLIEQRIVETKYMPDPRVIVEYANFRIFLLGAALGSNPGDGGRSGSNYYQQDQYSSFGRIPGVNGGVLQVYDKDRLNILEALSLINDMPMNADIEKVNVIRLIKGQYVTFRMNLKSVDIFQSPGFYLQQNDILYVEHRYRRDEFEGIQRVMQVSGYIFSSIASVVAIVALIKK